MTEKRTEDMIHEALEGGEGITQTKGHDQELIVTLMSLKGSLVDVNILHTYMVVSITKIKSSEVLSTTQPIQEIINDMNGKLVVDGEFIEGMKVRIHAPSTFFLKYHDHRRRIRAGTGADNTHLEKFLHYFLNFIHFWQRDEDKGEHWEEDFQEKGVWNDHEHHEKAEVPKKWKKYLGVWRE
jgi:hypothetical protein